jgi:Protein of unknown function (DUF3987)
LQGVSGFANKLPEMAVRLAGILAYIHNPNRQTLLGEDIDRGIALARYYLAEMLRLRHPDDSAEHLKAGRLLLKWLQTTWKEPAISFPDICHVGPNALRYKPKAQQAVEVLLEYGWLLPLDGPVTIKGQMRREAFRVRMS